MPRISILFLLFANAATLGVAGEGIGASAETGTGLAVPGWALALAAAILATQAGLAVRRGPVAPARWRGDVLRTVPALRRILVHPATRPIAQGIFALLFVGLIVVGFVGATDAEHNPAPIFTWTIWWGGILLAAAVAGKAWCYVCPWEAIAGWIENPTLRPDATGLGARRRWPRGARHIWLAIVLFVGLTAVELIVRVEESPRATAAIGVTMVTMTLVFVLRFERRAFCRYVCSIGSVTGLTSLLSPTEVRPAEPERCVACRTKDCFHGNQWGTGCPTSLFPASLTENTYCIDCLECVKTCPVDTMTLRTRPVGQDLFTHRNPRLDEAALALVFLALAFLHAGLSTQAGSDGAASFGGGRGLAVGAAIVVILVLAGAAHAGMTWLVRRVGTPTTSFAESFVALAYTLVPLALVLQLARLLPPLSEAGRAVPGMLADPLGAAGGGDQLAPLISPPLLWFLQVLLVVIGQGLGVRALLHRLSPALGEGAPTRASRILAVGAITALGVVALWILASVRPI